MTDSSLANERVDPARLAAVLENLGWPLAGEREGSYKRFHAPNRAHTDRWSLLVPMNREAADYSELMAAALDDLQTSLPDVWVDLISPRLLAAPSDAFRFVKETSAPSGLIAWSEGEELIESARATLLAGAKAHMEPARQYVNRFSQFARRYLDTVLMGQTAAGSYVVTAYAPTGAVVPLKSNIEGTLSFGDTAIEAVRSGDISESVVEALEAASEALAHYRQTSGSFAGFESGVSSGLSYEFTRALRDITKDADGASISVEWDPASRAGQKGGKGIAFEFSGGDHPVLEKAARQFAVSEDEQSYVARGRVHLLTKKDAGGPGVVGIDDGSKK